jgi:S1-C subfamily serine protease
MRLLALAAAGAVAIGSVSACAPVQRQRTVINFEGKQYSSWDAAFAAMRASRDEQLAAVKHVDHPVGGRALVVIPDADRLRPIENQKLVGNMAPQAPSFGEFDHEGAEVAGEALKRAGLFDQVEIVTRNNTVDPPYDGYDYVIFNRVATAGPNETGPWLSIWLVKRAPGSEAIQVKFDPGAPRLDWYNTFIESVRRAAIQMGAPGKLEGSTGSTGPSVSPGVNDTLTGVVVTASGDIVTNNHGVASCGSMQVQMGTDTFAATLVLRDRQNDLALLHVAHTFATAAIFRDTPLHQGDSVAAYGFPLDKLLASGGTFTTGSISAMTGIGDDTRFLQVSVPVQPGNSGGPLLDQSGHLVGIVTSKLNVLTVAAATGDIAQNVNFAIKGNLVREILESDNIQYATAPSGPQLQDSALAQRAQEIAVRIVCMK